MLDLQSRLSELFKKTPIKKLRRPLAETLQRQSSICGVAYYRYAKLDGKAELRF